MGLTNKQQKFVDEYMLDLNATQAAIRAGYSAKNADKIAYQLLGKSLVSEAIREAQAKAQADCGITLEKILSEYKSIAFSNVTDFLSFGKEGVSIKESADIPKDKLPAVAEITDSKAGFKIKLHAKNAALENLCKLLGFFPKDKEPDPTEREAMEAYSELVRLVNLGNLSPRWFKLIENEAGLAFSNSMKRFEVVAAGRRSGKDERGKRKGIKRACLGSSFPNPRYAFCAPTLGQAKQIFWNDLKMMIPRKYMSREPSETELSIMLINGAELCVRGLDKPQRIEGSPWDGFVFTEVDDMKPGFWEEHLRPCLSDRLGWAIFNGVPEGYGVLYDLRETAFANPDEWAYFTWKSSEVIAASEIESARNTLDERTFRQEYEAAFENAAGLTYYAFSRKDNVASVPANIAALELSLGMDFNVNPMCAVVFADFNGITYVIDEIVIPYNSNTAAMVAEVQKRYGRRCSTVYPDPTGRKGATNAPVGASDHEILRQAGFEVFCRGQVFRRDSQNALNSRLCAANGQRRLIIDPKCKTLIEGLERNESKDDEFSHITDALKYPMEYLHPVRQRQEWQQ